jgi:uncharacterized protein YmfQ (DUF2313 family)
MGYGDKLYGTMLYHEEDLIPIDEITPFIPDLMMYLPQYYKKNNVMLQIQGAIAKQIGIKQYTRDDVLKQFFVDTATWGLLIYESELGLQTDETKTYDNRREIIKAKIRGSGSTTKTLIKNVASAFSGGEVDVIEYPSEYRFEVQFVGSLGIPPNMAGFIAMLEDIKPAFMTYSFKYTYTVWNNVDSMTWNEASTKTWNQLRVYEGV